MARAGLLQSWAVLSHLCTRCREWPYSPVFAGVPAPDRRRKPNFPGICDKIRFYRRLLCCGNRSAFRRASRASSLLVDETCSKPWGILRLLTSCERRKGRLQGPRSFGRSTWGYQRMSSLRRTLAAAALSLATLVPAGYAAAADLPVKALKKVAPIPFFLVI